MSYCKLLWEIELNWNYNNLDLKQPDFLFAFDSNKYVISRLIQFDNDRVEDGGKHGALRVFLTAYKKVSVYE